MHFTTSCNTQSSVLEDGRDHRPKHAELIGIINKLLLFHLVGVYIKQCQFLVGSKTSSKIWVMNRSQYQKQRQQTWKDPHKRLGMLTRVSPYEVRIEECYSKNVWDRKFISMMKPRSLRITCWLQGKGELFGFMLHQEHGLNLN